MSLIALSLALRRFGIVPAGCIAALLLCAGPGHAKTAPGRALEHGPTFVYAAAAIGGRIQMLRFFERQMLANSSNADRAELFHRMRSEARRRIDELAALARANAAGAGQRERLEQLARMTALADIRFASVRQGVTQLSYQQQGVER